MAFSIVTASGSQLIIPDSSVDISVTTAPTGVSASGIVTIIGESDEGPSWTQDLALGNKPSINSFGPTDIGRVVAKYGSGNVVDAFRAMATPSSSNRIQGSPNRIIIVKTNDSTKASYSTLDGHGTFTSKRGGEQGNQVQQAISTSTPEVAPTSGTFSYIPHATLAAALALRVNGGAKQTLAITANMTPAALASAITGLSNMNAVGGVDKGALTGLTGVNIQLAVLSGQSVQISLATPNVFAGTPAVGDTLRIPSGSVIASGSTNVGWYMVTAVSNVSSGASITALKITTGAPSAVAPTAISATPANDMVEYSSMKLNNMSGTDRNILTGLTGQNITSTALSSNLTMTLTTGQLWASSPVVGDIVYIPSGSAYQGAGNANVGWYQVTSTSNTLTSALIKMSRLSNGSPVSVTATAIAASSDIQNLDPQIAGIGKTLELYDDGGATNINTEFKLLGANTPATFPETLLTSSAELKKTFSLVRNSTNSQETFTVGGNIAFLLGYHGTTATCTIGLVSGTLRLQTSVVGGAGGNLDIDLSKVASINDLVSKINVNTGYLAAAFSNAEGSKNPSALDQTTFSIASDLGSKPGRVKHDIWDITKGQSGLTGSTLVTYTALLTAGLPMSNTSVFLNGGAKGGTTGLQFSQAVDACSAITTNFVVPLVSQDASSDIALGKTDSSSTYTVDAVNAAIKSHCLNMSTAKIKKHRIGAVSKRGTFNECKLSAQTMSSYRIAHLFQDVLNLDSNGQIAQFQPWMGAAVAASMQAAGAYKAIFNKNVNISGAKQAAGDFDDENLSQLEDALSAGLIPIQKQDTGGWNFVSDQLTYGLDNSFFYNSMQAVYSGDRMALSLAQSLKTAFVGENVADVTVGVVESFVKGKLAEFLSLKLTVGTSKYPSGWKSIGISITPGVLAVNVSVQESTSLYFIPISLEIFGISDSNAA